MKKTQPIHTYTGLTKIKLFWALSRTPHGILDMATPALGALLWLGRFPSFEVILIGLIISVVLPFLSSITSFFYPKTEGLIFWLFFVRLALNPKRHYPYTYILCRVTLGKFWSVFVDDRTPLKLQKFGVNCLCLIGHRRDKLPHLLGLHLCFNFCILLLV